MAAWLSKQTEALKQKGLWYWIRALVIISAGVWAGNWLAESNVWLDKRRHAYRWLMNLSPRETRPRWVQLVLIEDDEYWLGELARRVPIRRDCLATLVRAVAEANPKLIALDFNLRSPDPEGNPVEHEAYQAETEDLLDAVAEVATQCRVVLPQTLGKTSGGYTIESDIYNGYHFGKRVLKGYIQLPADERAVPAAPLRLHNGQTVDSFARAIVRAVRPEILKKEDTRYTLPYSDFIKLEAFPIKSARDVLRHERSALEDLAHGVIIIGAHWHRDALNRGPFIDMHGSPYGDMSGVVLHANYVEAILDSRLHRGWSPFATHLVEGLGAMLVALIFAFEIGPIAKVAAVVAIGLILIAISAVSLLFFGLVFDFFVPVVVAIGHGLVERALEWRDAALRHRA